VAQVEPALERQQRHRPVHGAGVEHLESERVGDTSGDRRLARPGGAVDGDDPDHEPFSPAKAARSSAKRGYDLPTECQPRTVDSPRSALAATAAASAMRWSPWLLNSVGRGAPPRIVNESRCASTSTPIWVSS